MIKLTAAAVLAVFAAGPTFAAKPADDAAIGAAFLRTCIQPAPDHGAIKAGIAADAGWDSIPVPAELTLKPSGADATLSTWRQAIDGHEVLLVLIENPKSKGLKHNCAFVIRDERSAMWYFRSVSDNLKKYGMKLNQQDIPHWRLHKGKFANGQPGQVELRSRSEGLPGKDVLHLAVAY